MHSISDKNHFVPMDYEWYKLEIFNGKACRIYLKGEIPGMPGVPRYWFSQLQRRWVVN